MKNLSNCVQLIGNLGKDVEILEVGNGGKLAKVSIATSDYYYNKEGEKIESTEWHNLVAWGKTAELMSSLTCKGSQLMISGKLTNRSYENKEGVKKYVTEVKVDNFQLLRNGAERTKNPF